MLSRQSLPANGQQPIAISQQPPARLRTNGAITSRQGPDGTVWCPRCQDFLPATEFGWDSHARRPDRYCRQHRNAYAAAQFRRQGLDPDWWQRALANGRARYARTAARQKQARRQEQGDLARVLLRALRARGLTLMDVETLCGVGRKTQRRIEAGAEVTHASVLQRLAWAQEACQDLPPLSRTRGSRRHPHLHRIVSRYQWLAAGAT